MIQTKAVVNEENADPHYWRNKYNALVEKTSRQRPQSDNDRMVVDQQSSFNGAAVKNLLDQLTQKN